MPEQNLLCHRCGNIFRLTVGDSFTISEAVCSACGGSDAVILPSWEPLGSNLSEAPYEWEYQCQACSRRFRLPVPQSPSQEKTIRCPYCENGHIHRITAYGREPLYCG